MDIIPSSISVKSGGHYGFAFFGYKLFVFKTKGNYLPGMAPMLWRFMQVGYRSCGLLLLPCVGVSDSSH